MKLASYCRVSTDAFDQVNSFESQCRYYADYIASRPGWELFKVYADEGLSGTATEKRSSFLEMIRDAENGCFEMILTKEVSRFSRNILDTIYYTRKLKACGVFVYFVNDGINTADPDSELRLSIMGSIAQEESRKTSDRVKWGQQRRMEQGVVFGRSMLGYDVLNGKMTIEPIGAELIRNIFESYTVKKMSSSEVCKSMAGKGYNISPSRLIKILKNEKYKGDLVQKKTYTPDYLSHKKKYNYGAEELVIIRNHHEPIVSQELWERTQEEIKTRARRKKATGSSRKHAFSGRLNCGLCSSVLVARKRSLKNEAVIYWGCPNKTCSLGKRVRNDAVEAMAEQALLSLGIEVNKECAASFHEILYDFKLFPDKASLRLKHLPHEWFFAI